MTMAALAPETTGVKIQPLTVTLIGDLAGTGENVLTGGAAWVEEGK